MSANTSTPMTSASAPNTIPMTDSILAPLSAHDVLLLVQPFGVIGVSIRDLADPTTWTFDGGDPVGAHQAVVDALAVIPTPDPVSVLDARLDALTQHVTKLEAAAAPVAPPAV